MGAWRETEITREIRIMASPDKKHEHIKVKICGDVDEILANRIRLLMDSYNKQSDRKVSYKITCLRDHKPS